MDVFGIWIVVRFNMNFMGSNNFMDIKGCQIIVKVLNNLMEFERIHKI